MIDISVVIIAMNAEKTINQTLLSLQQFSEVILYLNNSTDDTQKIAEQLANVTVVKGFFDGFGTTKNRASTYAKNDWILSLDSDESLPTQLTEEIATLSLKQDHQVFILKRDNYFLGKHIKHSGWGHDLLIRIYNKTAHQFHNKTVHESVATNTSTISTQLKQSFKHDAVQDINQFLQKVMKYSDLAAKDKKTCSFTLVILKAGFAFFKTFILQLGFLDGWRGFVIAISNFNGKFFRYTKRYINCKKL